MNNLFKTFLSILFYLIFAQQVYCQVNVTQIFFKNGTSIKGQILSQDTLEVRIKAEDGREFLYKLEEIDRIFSGPETSSRRFVRNKRSVFVPNAKGVWISADFQGLNPPGMSITGGYKFHQFGFLGIGTGFNNYMGALFAGRNAFAGPIIPLYVRYGGDILKTRVTPYYAIEVGYGFAVNGSSISNDFINSFEVIDRKGGAYGSLGFGVKFITNKKISFGLCLNYKIQQSSITYNETIIDPNTGDEVSSQVLNNFINHRFGLKLIFIGLN